MNLNFVASRRHFFLRETASNAPSCVKIGLVDFVIENDKKRKKSKGKKAQKVTQALYFTYLWGSLCKRIFTKFCTSEDMPYEIISANFGVKKLWDLGYTNFGVSH